MEKLTVNERNKLVEDNLKLVYAVVHKHYPNCIQDEDLLQEGRIGLIKAANSYDPERSKFSTWAMCNIKMSMQREFMRRKRLEQYPTVSLDELRGGEDDDTPVTLLDTLVDTDNYSNVFAKVAISQLKPHLQETVYMLLAGFNQREIAKKLGITHQAVQYRLQTIRKVFNQNGITY